MVGRKDFTKDGQSGFAVEISHRHRWTFPTNNMAGDNKNYVIGVLK